MAGVDLWAEVTVYFLHIPERLPFFGQDKNAFVSHRFENEGKRGNVCLCVPASQLRLAWS